MCLGKPRLSPSSKGRASAASGPAISSGQAMSAAASARQQQDTPSQGVGQAVAPAKPAVERDHTLPLGSDSPGMGGAALPSPPRPPHSGSAAHARVLPACGGGSGGAAGQGRAQARPAPAAAPAASAQLEGAGGRLRETCAGLPFTPLSQGRAQRDDTPPAHSQPTAEACLGAGRPSGVQQPSGGEPAPPATPAPSPAPAAAALPSQQAAAQRVARPCCRAAA